ncbi:PIR protein [Plasmodium ovale]|uniref:PIR protein n=1 Tax=Plasmodium ovale TaxID=36330 RepID=A0A1C3KXU3_PLAOA|nr:PIR protein [Plasmodium ovale]
MATDDYENNLPATSYFNYMNNKNIRRDEYFGNTFNSVMDSANPEIITIGSLFYRNFTRLRFKKEDYNNRCSALNHWLNLEKVKHRENYRNNHDALWTPIENLWNKINEERYRNNKCDRKISNESLINIQKRYKLGRFCENRDYLKGKCQSVQIEKRNIDNNCYYLTKYVNKYYVIFLAQESCLPDKNDDPDNPFFISNECSLYDMTKTFPEYNIQDNTISEKEIARTTINLCSELEKLSPYGTERGALDPEILAVTEAPSESSSNNNSLYGGIAIMGFLPVLFYVYKFTSLVSWLRSRIMKTEIVRTNMDNEESYNSIDDPSDIIPTNSENIEYCLGYEPT